jgi:phage shock protein A
MATIEQELETIVQAEKNPAHNDTAILTQALSEMNFSEAAKQLLLDPSAAQADIDSLASINLTQEHLSQIKKSLGAIVDSMQDNPSLISAAAKFWGELPLWQRIVGGVAISGPTLVVGAAAHIGFLVTVSGVSALLYTTSGFVLDDHHFHTKNIAQKLKDGIFGVAEVLELTIIALDSICKKLAKEIDKFKAENEKLAKNIVQLNEDVETLASQVDVYIATERLLRKTVEDLELTGATLKKDLEKNALLFEANQKEIVQVKESHAKSMLQLSEKVSELAEVRETMSAEVNKVKIVASMLNGTVEKLSGAVINDSGQRQAFLEKLGTFLNDKSREFDQVAGRITEAEKELVEVKSALKKSNERYKILLIQQEEQIRRLEKLDLRIEGNIPEEQYPPQAQVKESVKSSSLLSALGMLASPQSWIKASPAHESDNQKDSKLNASL